MAKKRVSKALWDAIAPLLPEHKPSPKGGRPPVPDRACLEGIIFVLKTGMPRQMLPTELGYGSGSTCWRRFRDWTRLGSGRSCTDGCSAPSGGAAGSIWNVRSSTAPR